MKNFTFFLAVLILIGLIVSTSAAPQTVIMNKTYVVEPSGTTPFNIWAAGIIIGIALILVSLLRFPDGEEGLVSVIAWFPLGFSLFTSFAVDRITSIGYATDPSGTPILIETHTVSNFWTVAILIMVLLAFALGNTYRIYAYQATRAGISEE